MQTELKPQVDGPLAGIHTAGTIEMEGDWRIRGFRRGAEQLRQIGRVSILKRSSASLEDQGASRLAGRLYDGLNCFQIAHREGANGIVAPRGFVQNVTHRNEWHLPHLPDGTRRFGPILANPDCCFK